MTTVTEAVAGVNKEAGENLLAVNKQLSTLDFTLTSLNSLVSKYNLLTRKVIGLSYDSTVKERSLPPISPSSLFDQTRLGLMGVTVLGDLFFPTTVLGDNLRSTQEFYSSVGDDLDLVRQQLSQHPPGKPASNTFTNASNRYKVRSLSARKPNGAIKSRSDLAEELGVSSFDVFVFTDPPQLVFLVLPEYIGSDESMSSINRKWALPISQVSNRVNWFGGINATSNNFSAMRVNLGLSNPQIRAASFGDDMAISSSSLFKTLLTDISAGFSLVESFLPDKQKLLNILNNVQQKSFEFLAQITFGTTVLADVQVLGDASEAGVRNSDLEFAFQNRTDPNFTGAALRSNALLTTVFPPTSNTASRKTLSLITQQEPNTALFTNKALNVPTNLRENVVKAAKNLVAGLTARSIAISQSLDQLTTLTSLKGVQTDINALQTAYSAFLEPTNAAVRQTGSRTTESANITLLRTCNLVKTLRIADQITNFPKDFSGEVNPDLQQVLGSLSNMATIITTYLNIYRSGEIRDFLSSAISVSSMSNFILADGEPSRSLIVQEVPAAIDNLKASIQTIILGDPDSQNFYRDVSLQLGAFASVLGGTSEDDPVGKMFDLPLAVLDALLPSTTAPKSFSITLEGDQEPALRQIRESFDVLRQTVPAIIRDLRGMSNNFGCAFTDAKFFVSKLAGDSIGELVTALRQS